MASGSQHGQGHLLMALLPVLLVACVTTPADPQRAACLQQMERQAQALMPAFANLGYQPSVILQLDENLANSRGFAAPPSVLGDSLPGGRIRIRPQLCGARDMTSIVVAHEMAHVALQHHGQVSTGVTLAWETPRNEVEADALAHQVLKASGARGTVLDYLACRLGQCSQNIPGLKRKPVGSGN